MNDGRFHAGTTVNVLLRTTCNQYLRVAKTTLQKNGHWRAVAPAVQGEYGVYRASTTVLKGRHDEHTYTLLRAP